MFDVRNFIGSNANNPNMRVTSELGPFTIVEYERDLSVGHSDAMAQYYMSKMNVRRRQLVCEVKQDGIMLQAGALQWMIGDCNISTGVKGAGDFAKKAFRGKVTGESVVKPIYTGDGVVTCEPTYKHLILTDAADWSGGLVLDDGLFMACEAGLNHSLNKRQNVSSAIAGGKGFFSLCLSGQGVACLESKYPMSELIEINLEKDTVKIDGPLAIAWSGSLEFTVECATGSPIGSVASGEGLVNAYRGTGRIWMMPVK